MMETKSKLWLGLGVVCMAGVITACSGPADDPHAGMNHSTAEEGGEGGEGASSEESLASDAVYLAQLGFIRGHLLVGVELYREGFTDHAETHMKHPESEIYADLVPALEARNAPGFGDELGALAVAVEQRRPVEEVNGIYDSLLTAISAAEQVVQTPGPRLLGDVIVDMVSTAAAEYDIAVADDLTLENAHEYQDSYGFMQVAYAVLSQLEAANADADAVSRIREQLDSIMPAWSGLNPPARLHTQASVIYGAASRVELVVSGL